MMTNKEVEAALDRIQPPDDLFENGNSRELEYCKFTLPAWRDRLIQLVGRDNYRFMCEQNMVHVLQKQHS